MHELDFTQPNTALILQLLKSVGRASLAVGRIYEGHVNALYLIYLFASPAQQEKWFADAENGCLFGVWNTQADNGIEIIAGGEHEWVLQGKKTFASGAGLVNRALITGNIQDPQRSGWQMCIVDMDDITNDHIDFQSWQPLGMESSVSYTFDFTGTRLPSSQLFGNAGDYFRQPYFSGGAIRFTAVQLGGAEALFNHTTAFLKNLNRTADPFQSSRIATMTTSLTSGNLWLKQAGQNFDAWHRDEKQSRRLVAFANMTRSMMETICLQVVELSAKCMGARGLMQPHPMEQQLRDLLFYLRQPAPDAALMDVAKYMIESEQDIQTIWE